ncbi:SRPBCC family protein [Oceanobacillus sp. CAU 1775]
MKEILCYTYEVELDAEIDLVFDCLNKDKHVLNWNTQIIENIYEGNEDELTEGSTFITKQKLEKKVYEFSAKYSKYNPPNHAIVETVTKEGISRTEYYLEEIYGETRFTVKVYLIPSNWIYKLLTNIFKGSFKYVYDDQFDSFVDYVHDQVYIHNNN